MIKSQPLIPFLLRNVSRSSSLSFQQFAKCPFYSTSQLTFKKLADFSSQNDSNNAEKSSDTAPLTQAEKEKHDLEDWGSRPILSKEEKKEVARQNKILSEIQIIREQERRETNDERKERQKRERKERLDQENREKLNRINEMQKKENQEQREKMMKKMEEIEAMIIKARGEMEREVETKKKVEVIKEDSGTKQEEKKEKKTRKVKEEGRTPPQFSEMGYLMNRIVKTSLEYAKLGPEKRALITKESRFYYVKERLEKLSEEDEKRFIECLESYDTFAGEKVKIYMIKERGPPKEVQIEMFKENLLKSFVIEFLTREFEFEPVISDLLINLMNKENPDFINLSKDEIQDKRHGKVIKLLNENLEKLRRDYTKQTRRLRHSYFCVPRLKLSKPRDQEKKRYPAVFNLLRVIFIRIVQTLTVYIESPSQIRESVPKISRFYYVHKRIGSWSQAEQNSLWEYLDSIKVDSAYGMTEEQVGKTMNKRRILGNCNQTELFYMLNHEKYGALLKELLVDFFEEDNLDKFYFLNTHQSEFQIGEFGPAHKKMITPVRNFLIENMDTVRLKLQQFLDFSDPKLLTAHGQHPGGPRPRRPSLRRMNQEY